MPKFRVALSGPTIDGRDIPRQHIEEMAANYDPIMHTANLNIEHIIGSHPDKYRNMGHVKSLETEEFRGNLALIADIDPTDELKKWTDNKQKCFTSIEYLTDYAGTKQAGLVHIAVTDDPASFGTQILKFNRESNKIYSESLFSAGIEFEQLDKVGLNDASADGIQNESWFSGVRSKLSGKHHAHDQRFSNIEYILNELALEVSELQEKLKDLQKSAKNEMANLDSQYSKLSSRLNDLIEKLSASPSVYARPPHSGAAVETQYLAEV